MTPQNPILAALGRMLTIAADVLPNCSVSFEDEDTGYLVDASVYVGYDPDTRKFEVVANDEDADELLDTLSIYEAVQGTFCEVLKNRIRNHLENSIEPDPQFEM